MVTLVTRAALHHWATFVRHNGNVLSMSGFFGQEIALDTLASQIAAETIAGRAGRFDAVAKLPTPASQVDG